MTRLGVNIDHVATLRQARRTIEPDPVAAAVIVELAGAGGITIHLREDRRHINDRDVELLRKTVQTKLNLEMSIVPGIVKIASFIKPDQATLVPEKREEVTTEGGLDVASGQRKISQAVKTLTKRGIVVSLFIDPDKKQIEAAKKTKAPFIELHTGKYANAKGSRQVKRELDILTQASIFARSIGLRVNAGHGLNYQNTAALLEKMPDVEELNIGHSIISRAVLVGLDQAVREMKAIIDKYSL